MTDMANRWRTALHEAGHLITAWTLTPPPRSISCAHLIAGGGGLAWLPTECMGFSRIVAIAAGRQAARWADSVPIPERTATDRPEPETTKVDARNAVADIAAAPEAAGGPSDATLVVEYAIDLSSDYDEAERRIRRITAAARHAVCINQAAILAMARELFLNGSAVLDEDAGV